MIRDNDDDCGIYAMITGLMLTFNLPPPLGRLYSDSWQEALRTFLQSLSQADEDFIMRDGISPSENEYDGPSEVLRIYPIELHISADPGRSLLNTFKILWDQIKSESAKNRIRVAKWQENLSPSVLLTEGIISRSISSLRKKQDVGTSSLTCREAIKRLHNMHRKTIQMADWDTKCIKAEELLGRLVEICASWQSEGKASSE